MSTQFTGIFVSLLIPILVGCSTAPESNRVYSNASLTSAARTIEAVVVSKREVVVDPRTGLGSTAGGTLGAIGGSSIGSTSRDNLAGAVVGALVGAAVGAAVESSVGKIPAYEYIVKSDVAGLLTIVQVDGTVSVGQDVFVVLGSRPMIVKASQ